MNIKHKCKCIYDIYIYIRIIVGSVKRFDFSLKSGPKSPNVVFL